jgi:hypothetical protein
MSEDAQAGRHGGDEVSRRLDPLATTAHEPHTVPDPGSRRRDVGGPWITPASPLVDVPALVSALRRRWLVVLASALVFMGLAITFSLLSPPQFSASTVLLLRHPSQSDQLRAIETDALLARTRTVAERAIEGGGLDLAASDLAGTYQATVLSQDLLRLRGTGPDAPEAVRRTSAIADAYLAFRGEELRRQSSLAIRALEERQDGLREELASIGDRINDLSGQPDQSSDEAVKLLGDLLSRRAAVNSQLAGLGQQIDVLELRHRGGHRSEPRDRRRGQIPARRSGAMILNMVTGAIAGSVLGAGGVILHTITSNRVRRRERA